MLIRIKKVASHLTSDSFWGTIYEMTLQYKTTRII